MFSTDETRPDILKLSSVSITQYDQQEAKESFASPDNLFYGKSHIVKQLYRKNGKKPFLFAFNTTTKKEYLIEAHFYVKGRFNLHFPDSVKPSSIPKFGLCSEETGSTNKKLNIQTFPHTHSVKRHQRFCL